MQQSPITNKSVGLPKAEKFRDVRAKAKEEEFIRKSKRNKRENLPKYSVGDVVVITQGLSNKREYILAEIIDFESEDGIGFEYYGIVLNITSKKCHNRLGRLIKFSENRWFGWQPANVENKNIKWYMGE